MQVDREPKLGCDVVHRFDGFVVMAGIVVILLGASSLLPPHHWHYFTLYRSDEHTQ